MADAAPTVRPEPRGPARPGRRPAVWGLGSSLAVALVLTAAVATGGALLTGFDEALTDFTRGWADELGWPVDVAHVIGEMTEPVWSGLFATVLVITFAAARFRAVALLLALSSLMGVAATAVLKVAVGRTRPPGAEQFKSDLETSFPSGHSSAGIYIFLAAGVVLLHVGRANDAGWAVVLGRLLVVTGPLLGVTRLILGVHWPSDILAGWALGSAAVLAAALLLWPELDRGWVREPAEPRAGPDPEHTTG